MTVTQYLNTPVNIITEAYMETGLLSLGQVPDSQQLARGMSRLNAMINLWQTQGLKLWLELDLPITLTAGQYLYPQTSMLNGILTKPTRVKEGYFLFTPGNPTGQTMYPLIAWARNDWDMAGTRNDPGTVTAYFAEKLSNVLNVYLWQAPSAAFAAQGQVHLVLQQQQTNAVMLTDQMVLPIEWGLGLIWGLADELATGQPLAIQQRCSVRASLYREALENWDVEDAPTEFQPDAQMFTGNNRFV